MLVEKRTPDIATYENAFTQRFLRDGPNIFGAIYDRSGHIIENSKRLSGIGGDRLINADPATKDRPKDATRIRGRGLWIGNIFAHYGHFITEGLNSLWPLLDGRKYDYFAAHHFVFGRAIEPYAAYCYARLGVDPIHIIDGPTVFDCLDIPERSWLTNKVALQIHREITNTIRPACGTRDLCIYLSRLFISNRQTDSAMETEAAFHKAGFSVVYPEKLHFDAQLLLFSRAKAIAGYSGSALHSIMFCEDGTRTINVGDERSPNKPILAQVMCSELAKSPLTFIPLRQAHSHAIPATALAV